MSKILVFLAMFCFSCSISFAGEGDCHTFLYHRDHPEECLSKEEFKKYRASQAASQVQAAAQAREEKNYEQQQDKVAPPISLMNTLIDKCIADPYNREFIDSEIMNSDGSKKFIYVEIKEGSRTKLEKVITNGDYISEVDKLNGFEWKGGYKFNYIYKTPSNGKWHEGSFFAHVIIENSTLDFYSTGGGCHYTVNMNDKNAEINDSSYFTRDRKQEEANAAAKANYNNDNDAASREARRQAFIKKIKGE